MERVPQVHGCDVGVEVGGRVPGGRHGVHAQVELGDGCRRAQPRARRGPMVEVGLAPVDDEPLVAVLLDPEEEARAAAQTSPRKRRRTEPKPSSTNR
eukprot:6709594-Lingulodinium_polyedra.AAC.1